MSRVDCGCFTGVLTAPTLKVVQEWSRDQDGKDGGGNEEEDWAKYVAVVLDSSDGDA